MVTKTGVNFFDTTTRNWRARLAISVDVMRELSCYADPSEMYSVFVRRMNQLFPTSRQISLTRRGLFKPDYRVTRFNLWNHQGRSNDISQQPVHHGGLLTSLLYSDETRVIDDLHLVPNDPAAEYLDGQRSVLSIPLFENGQAMNCLVLAREEPHAFPPEHVPELVLLSNLFSRALQTSVLAEALKDAYSSADFELKAVAELQRSLLPPAVPEVRGLDLAAEYRTAWRAGGDLYDFFPLPDGKLGVLIADVSGHGTPAAVLMAITHTLAHNAPQPPICPGEFLTYLNDKLAAKYTTTNNTFITAFYAVFDPNKGTVTYSSAGHVPPRLVRASDGDCIPLNRAQRLPLGINPRKFVYPEETVSISRGDAVVMFTDGLTETTDRVGNVFGTDRIDAALLLCTGSAHQMLGAVRIALETFAAGDEAKDDQTLLVVKVL
ncbi:MAG: GAF domain-containing SpoIIE family protein phosphatase [Gemmataceae bacterium]